jgi:predicted ribosome quality control (RQC) complex YloA/Tae2 family protein
VDQQTIQKVVDELTRELTGRFLGKVFQLSPLSFAIDAGLRQGRYLFVSADPSLPRIYLIKRRLKDLEKTASPLSQFAQAMSATFGGASIERVAKDNSDRVVRFYVRVIDEIGEESSRTLVAQLTGRSANLFLLDGADRITNSLRSLKGSGQEVGQPYDPPQAKTTSVDQEQPSLENLDSISAELDSYYQRIENERSFQSLANNVQGRLRAELKQKAKLKQNLENDLLGHGDPEQHRRLGDLLLANIATAERTGQKVVIRDFYSEGEPSIELEVDEKATLQEEATKYFSRYTKAKRAREELTARLASLDREIKASEEKQAEVNKLIEQHDEEALQKLITGKSKPGRRDKTSAIPGVRTYRSSEGFEVLVGRAARDNDHLTFRVAGPNDLWLHAADYPGSHVVVRRTNRKEIPHRTIVEAAQLAARFSQAGKDSKVVVHYTPRKFLSKPRGAAPGLVRMSSFKTILVEPKEAIERVGS